MGRLVRMSPNTGNNPFGGLLSSLGGLSRNVLGILLGVILSLLLIGFLVIRAVTDGGDNDAPAPTMENVLGPNGPSDGTEGSGTATPGADAGPAGVRAEPTQAPTEEERLRGGDNRRKAEGTPEGTLAPEGNRAPSDIALASPPVGDGTGAAAAATDPTAPTNRDIALAGTPVDASAALAGDGTGQAGSVARSCSTTCLLRVAGSAGLEAVLARAGTRASFAAEKWSWVVASTEGAAHIEANVPTVLVSPKVNTLNAYVVRMPEGNNDEAAVTSFGTVVDAVDRYRIVEVGKVPALVTPLVENGFEVFKMAPAPTARTTDARELTPLANIDIGELLDDVDPANLEATIRELQGTSSTDGSGVGSRFYSLTGNAMACEYLFQRMEALGMKVWYEDFISPDGLLLVNVVGELPGADTNAVYSVMAHLDSISTETSNAPGADDNATGIAASLEIARILTGYELRHPVRLVFVNGEEVGILGSESWARNIVAGGVPVEGVFNIDSVGSDRQGTLIWLNSDARSAWMQELIVDINNAYGLGQDLATRQNPNIVADDNKVREQGIEAVMVARELYGFSPVHHTSNDLIENVSIENTLTTTQLILLSLATLVQ